MEFIPCQIDFTNLHKVTPCHQNFLILYLHEGSQASYFHYHHKATKEATSIASRSKNKNHLLNLVLRQPRTHRTADLSTSAVRSSRQDLRHHVVIIRYSVCRKSLKFSHTSGPDPCLFPRMANWLRSFLHFPMLKYARLRKDTKVTNRNQINKVCTSPHQPASYLFSRLTTFSLPPPRLFRSKLHSLNSSRSNRNKETTIRIH